MNRAPLAQSVSELSDRQRQVVLRYGEGLTLKQIAADLSIAPGTAKTHLQLACDRLGCTRRRELLLHARAYLETQKQGAS